MDIDIEIIYINSGLLFAVIFIAVALIYFGTHADTDKSWLKFPNLRTLSWSFYLAAIGGILALLAAMSYTVYWMKIRGAGRQSTAYRAHELRTYRQDRYYRWKEKRDKNLVQKIETPLLLLIIELIKNGIFCSFIRICNLWTYISCTIGLLLKYARI